MQDVLQVSKDAALKAHSEGDPSIKKMLETMYPTVFATPKRKWEDVTTFETVCEEMGEYPARFVIPANATPRMRGELLFAAYQLICEYFRQGEILDYAKRNQGKYYPYGEYSAGSGFSLNAVHYAYTHSLVGARLSVDSDPKARHMWKHFNHIIQDFWQWK